ncbi:MAG: hypothetical protein K1Y01_20655 [Vicinamibacteria bacterium]|nr:hypothetical protein [Vicinamibacteria bacterium]
MIRSTVVRAGLLLGAMGLSGCSAGYSTNNNSTVLLIIAAINGGAPLKSDVLKNGGVFNDNAELAIAVRFKNPNIDTVPQIPSAVVLERYEIKYRRSDGRGVEGQDVPFSISGNLTAAYDVKSSGTDPLSLEVVRVQAKLEPPLRNLQSGSGGGIVVTMFADITLHGRTISGQTVTATGSLQIDFANWADN